jgi:cytochrome c biogenesis protein CcmG, thiol:disulfide interchange protein DsbE
MAHGLGLLLTAVAGLIAGGCRPTMPGEGGGATAGEASAPMLAGAGGSFSVSRYRGQVVMLDFFASWSEPCRRELPGMEQIWRDFGTQGVAVVGLLLDEGTAGALADAARGLPVTYPVAQASPALREAVGGIRAVPTRVLIGRDGRVVRAYPGAVPASVLRGDVERLLQGSPPRTDGADSEM